jgi:PAS domain S-box-containing protein
MARHRFDPGGRRPNPVPPSTLDIGLRPLEGGQSWWRGLAAAADGAFAITSEGRITLWNRAATRIMGHEAHEALGRRCCDVFMGHDAMGHRVCSAACRLLDQIRNGEPVETFDLPTTAKGGRPIWLSMSTIVLPHAGTRAPRVIRMFRDVTALKDLLTLIRHHLTNRSVMEDPVGRLTRREVEILRLMVSGATNRALAERLHVSPATIRNHTHNIFEKLGVPNRLAAVVLAFGQFIL